MAAALRTSASSASGAAVALAAASSSTAHPSNPSVVFQQTVVDELAGGLQRLGVEANRADLEEITHEAADKGSKKVSTDDGISAVLFDVCMFPLMLLTLAATDPNVYAKLKSRLIKEGKGEWSEHLGSEAAFDRWLSQVYSWLVARGHHMAVQRLQRWRHAISLKWDMGGKDYVRLYFEQNHGTFPTDADSSLMFQAQAKAMEKFNKQLADQLSQLKAEKKRFACFKCGDPSHSARKCPHTPAAAAKLLKKRQSASLAAAKQVAASSPSASDSD
jgi:hypothetical protein